MPLIDLGSGHFWTLRRAVEGVQIFGGIGSGKTSGSGELLALKYLKTGMGGLVLTVKPNEKQQWIDYCRATGRYDDLIVVEPNNGNYFNFLEYESRDGGITENIVEVLKTVIRASEEKATGKTDDPFWEAALDILLFNVIDLCTLAYGKVSVQQMYDIVLALPNSERNDNDVEFNAYTMAMYAAKKNVDAQVKIWREQQTAIALNEIKTEEDLENAVCSAIADARTLKTLDEYFEKTYILLSEKTRSIIDFSFSGFLFHLLREPIYSLFCKHESNFTPDSCLDGKIILLNLPVKIYQKVGRDCQIMFKYIWQRAMEKRPIEKDTMPVFLWADEAQNFLHEHDTDYQATARSSRIATVYISQNLPNYLACMGGEKSKNRVDSFLGTMATKIFHANVDIETNRYASELIGDGFFIESSNAMTTSEHFSLTNSEAGKFDRLVRPEHFIKLKTGGPLNKYMVEGFMHAQGNPIMKNSNYTLINFEQNLITQ